MADPIVVAEGLHKSFGNTRALRGPDLSVPRGTVCGVPGPNGEGKTTAVRILATLSDPDAGHARIAGHDVVREAGEARARSGLAGQYAAVDEKLTGRGNLRMLGRLYHLSRREAHRRADELLERFGPMDAADRQVAGYSGGMRRRPALIACLIMRPKVLFLDEPTAGLDPSRDDGRRPAQRHPARRRPPARRHRVRELDRARAAAADVRLRRPALDEVLLRLTDRKGPVR